ncbi:MAG: amino acid synthesis family protein [Cryobacterium sp.]|nr:amino acid synthesis family protein [Cryobacterium sp.]
MSLKLRKVITQVETLSTEYDREVDPTIRTAIAAAVIRNPWVDEGFVEDLSPKIKAIAPELGQLLSHEVVTALGGGVSIEAYGKSAVVGLNGEIEHASALIHTLHFGNVFRDMAEGTSYLSFTNRRAGSGALVVIPMVHKLESWRRSHFITSTLSIEDAPEADEIVVAIAASTGGRPFERIGDRNQDLASGI